MTKEQIIDELEHIYRLNYDEFVAIRDGKKECKQKKLWVECAKEMENTHNGYGVPCKGYRFLLGERYGAEEGLMDGRATDYRGKLIADVNIGCEEDWGDIQPHCHQGNKGLVQHLCYGSELDHYVVKAVYDFKEDKTIRGRKKLLEWAEKNVWKWVDWYSA